MKLLSIDDVIKSLKNPPTDARIKVIKEAYAVAVKAHDGQKRKSGVNSQADTDGCF